MFRAITKDDFLDHPLRKQIYDYIVENPGATLSEVSRGCGTSSFNTLHHLGFLERFGAVRVIRMRGRKYLFGSEYDPLEALVSINEKRLRGSASRMRILELIEQRPGMTHSEIMKTMGISTGALVHHTRVLFEMNVIKSVTVGIRKLFFPIDHEIDLSTITLDSKSRTILEVIEKNGSLIQKDIVLKTGLPQSTVSRILRALWEKGLLVGRIEEKRIEYGLK